MTSKYSNRKALLLDILFVTLIGGLITFSLGSGLLGASILGPLPLKKIWIAFVIVLYFRLLLNNRYSLLIGSALTAVVVFGLYLSLIYTEYQAGWFRFFQRGLQGLFFFLTKQSSLLLVSRTFLGFLFFLFFGLFAVLNLHSLFHLSTLAVAGTAVLITPYYLGFPLSPRDIYFFLLCMLVLLIKRLNLFTRPREKGTQRTLQNPLFSLLSIVLAGAILGLALVLPKPVLEHRGSVEIAAERAYDSVAYRQQKTTSVNFTQEQTLGGPITLGTEEILSVKSPEPLYLHASYKDTYTGSQWTLSQKKNTALPLGEDGGYPVKNYSQNQQRTRENFATLLQEQGLFELPQKTVEITMLNHRTTHIYSPMNASRFVPTPGISPVREATGALSSRYVMKPEQRYQFEYSDWQGLPLSALELPTTYARQEIKDNHLEHYLTLPEGLPLRVVDKTYEVTDHATTAYDKMKALEAYLATFPYTLSPNPVPEDVDFVDHFLFEEQRGYCVYYASAMAVMGRVLGVPTRFVEGYAPSPLTARSAEGVFTVTNEQAHAWVEAYFPAIGWIMFEPTSPYHESMTTPEPPLPDPSEVPETPAEDTPLQEFLQEELARWEESSSPTEDQRESGDTETLVVNSRFLGWILGGGLLTGAFLLLLLLRRYNSHTQRQNQLPPAEQIIAYYQNIEHALAQLGYPPRPRESAASYGKRVGNSLQEILSNPPLENITAAVTTAIYSDTPPVKEDLELVKSYHKKLLRLCKKKNPFSYFYHHFLRLSY